MISLLPFGTHPAAAMMISARLHSVDTMKRGMNSDRVMVTLIAFIAAIAALGPNRSSELITNVENAKYTPANIPHATVENQSSSESNGAGITQFPQMPVVAAVRT